MKLLSKKTTILISTAILLCGCFHNEEPEQDGFTPAAQLFVDRILKENNTNEYNVDIVNNSGSDGLTSPIGYVLNIFVDTTVVLTNTIDSLRINGKYRYNKFGGGTGDYMVDLNFMGLNVKSDTLNNIRIITDTSIMLQNFGISGCKLETLPKEIGKLRVEFLNISSNNIKTLPLEIMSIFNHLSLNSGKIKTMDNPFSQNYWDSLPDTLQEWLTKHTYY